MMTSPDAPFGSAGVDEGVVQVGDAHLDDSRARQAASVIRRGRGVRLLSVVVGCATAYGQEHEPEHREERCKSFALSLFARF